MIVRTAPRSLTALQLRQEANKTHDAVSGPDDDPLPTPNEANACDRQELRELSMNGMRTVGGSLTMRRAETVLALQQCCGCVVRRLTSDIGGGVVSEEACKWKCVSVQRRPRGGSRGKIGGADSASRTTLRRTGEECSNREALRGLPGSSETIRIYQTTPCTDMDSRIHVLSLSFDDCARRAFPCSPRGPCLQSSSCSTAPSYRSRTNSLPTG